MNDWLGICALIFLFVVLALIVPLEEPIHEEWTQLEFDFEGKNNDNRN